MCLQETRLESTDDVNQELKLNVGRGDQASLITSPAEDEEKWATVRTYIHTHWTHTWRWVGTKDVLSTMLNSPKIVVELGYICSWILDGCQRNPSWIVESFIPLHLQTCNCERVQLTGSTFRSIRCTTQSTPLACRTWELDSAVGKHNFYSILKIVSFSFFLPLSLPFFILSRVAAIFLLELMQP